MSKIKYKVNGQWKEIEVDGFIEAIEYENPPSVLEINVHDDIKAESKMA